jgi:hypothetical protein
MVLLARQRASSDRRLAEVTARLGLDAQQRSAAATGARAQLESDLLTIGQALQDLQAVKDRLHELRFAIETPNSALKTPLLSGLSSAIDTYQAAVSALRVRVGDPEWRKPHDAKNRLMGLEASLKSGLRGSKYIEGCAPDVAGAVGAAIETIRDAQDSLRDGILRRQTTLNVGLA